MIKNHSFSLLILLLCMIGVDVSAHDIEVLNTDGVSIYYNYINDNTELAVTFAGDWYGYVNNEYSGVVVIPEEVTLEGRTLKVTRIDNSAFSGCYDLTSITIANSVTSIGDYAFEECRSLTSVIIPDGITSIGKYTFENCPGLTSVNIPNSVTSIGDYAFDCCTNLTSITIPNNVTTIGVGAFEYCNGLTSIDIPNSVTSIEDYTFASCNNLTSITIGNNVASIGNYAFAGCRSLTSITIPNNVTSIGDFALYKCSGLTSIDIGNGVTSIGNDAFWECTNLTSVTMGNSVTSIGEFAFYGCSCLKSITIPQSVTHIGSDVFFNCYDLNAVHISDLEAWCNIQFDGAFFGRYHLYLNGNEITNLTLPESVTSVGNYAFAKCYRLISITIPNGVSSIGHNAFSNCSNLQNIYCYSKQVPETGNNVFEYSNNDATLHVPAASVSAYQATKPWKNFKEIVALSTQEDDTDDANYLPFVEGGKQWHVVRSDNDSGCHLENYMMNEEAVKDGKTYIKMSRSEDDLDVIYDTGLFREEDRKIYIFDDERQEEHLMFDYSLKEGDTYETFSYDEEKMVTYKVLSVDDYTEGPQVRREVYDEKTGNLITHSRYLQKWTVCRTDDNSIQKTWIEGVGSLEGPLENLHDVVLPDLSKDYLAYVEKYSGYLYLPFSFYDTLNKQAHGCDLPTSESNKEYDDELNHLTYELEGDRLHVYGEVFGNCGPNQYAYFYEKPTDDPLVHRIEFEIQEVEPLYWCKGLHATDFYVPGFDPNINYIVVDNQGEEHPVINKTQQMAYRPFVEDGKVWKVGSTMIRDNLVKMVEYYYFDGDTIIDGKTCKQMMCQRYVNPDHPDYAIISQYPFLRYVGAWYEENKKVYLYNAIGNKMLMYDFSFDDYATLQIHGQSYVIGPKQAGGMKGFKGVYRDVMMLWDEEQNIYNTTWLEGVGGIDGPTVSVYLGEENHALFLMSCTVGDEVIYLNDEYEDGATPAEARKRRIVFTHTIKIQPKARIKQEESDACINSSERDVVRPKVKALMRNGPEESMYGEYNDQQLCINLDPLDDAYQVRITDESGKAVYEKDINAGSIVGLNIDISTYAKGRYTVTVENSGESFTGKFGAGNADANGDGGVNVADVDYVIEHIGEAFDEKNKAADVNDDGEINVADVDYIIERIK